MQMKYQIKKKKLEKEFYKDFTFKPSLIPVTNPNYQVKGDFLERNYKFIEKKNEKRKKNKQHENKNLLFKNLFKSF